MKVEPVRARTARTPEAGKARVIIEPKDAIPLACLLAHAVRGDIAYDAPTKRAAVKILFALAAACEALDGDAYAHLGGACLDGREHARAWAEYNRVRQEMDPNYEPYTPAAE